MTSQPSGAASSSAELDPRVGGRARPRAAGRPDVGAGGVGGGARRGIGPGSVDAIDPAGGRPGSRLEVSGGQTSP